ncbi:hypothetical protein [Streptomyces sp. 2224.1]|uniref:hypothetical protein n=1 Tax=Streptomyces sp. 2224.1 TaxID=1881020 RepID=UPI00210CE52A|nr:hypothetical protein [Streptomyces sp. 2224.1]
MRRTTTVAAASAAVLCLGSLLTGCGSAADQGYAAVGAAGPSDDRAPSRAVPPEDGVELTPLDGDGGRADGDGHGGDRGGGDGGSDSANGGQARPGRTAPESPVGAGEGDEAGGTGAPGSPGASDAPSGSSASPSGAHDSHSGHGSHSGGATPPASPGAPNSTGHPGGSTPPHGSPAPQPPSPTIPAGPGAPAGLLIGKPALAGTDVRWCQKVTVDFLNNGDRPVTAGRVVFGTHVIGALGIDWATLTSTHPLPLPLAVGRRQTGTWRVCVDGWRVPPGMHLDTKDVTFRWK